MESEKKVFRKKKNSLAEVNPTLAAQWHPTKNGDLKPEYFAPFSHEKVWWICDKGHDWKTRIADRSKGKGCPYCANKFVWPGFNDLLSQCPSVAAQWHPTKNGELRPEDVTVGSHTKVWWLCPDCGHEWRVNVYNRTQKGTGCPACKNRLNQPRYGALTIENPTLAAQWHPTKNGDLKPSDVTAGSGKKVWWQCEKGHAWKATIGSRNSGNGCPHCALSKASSFREKAILYYFQKIFPDVMANIKGEEFPWLERMELDIYVPSLKLAVEYDGAHHKKKRDQRKNDLCLKNNVTLIRVRCKEIKYELTDSINFNLKDSHIDSFNNILYEVYEYIFNNYGVSAKPDIDVDRDRFEIMEMLNLQEQLNSFASVYPFIAKEWHPTKNGCLKPSMVTRSNDKKVWWICEKGHDWEATVAHRAQGKGCPYCANKKIWPGYNDLASTHENIAKEWHPTKNGDLKPTDVTAGSDKKVWWICEHGHEWPARVVDRKRYGCPYCTNQKVWPGFNDLEYKNPTLAAQWHPTKNGDLKPSEVTFRSGKKVWWQCEKGHAWPATVDNRAKGENCPYCIDHYSVSNKK